MAPPVVSNDQIVKQLTTSWEGSETGRERSWFTSSVNFSLPTSSPIGEHNEQAGFVALTQHEQDMGRLSFKLWGDLMNLGLNEAGGDPNDAQITLAKSSNTDNRTHTHHDSLGTSEMESKILVDERIWLASQWNSNQSNNIQYGKYGLETYIHEIGHSLGLSHPGVYDAADSTAPTYANDAEYSRDTRQYTVMSYFDENSDGSGAHYKSASGNTHYYASTPMVDDILAIQAKYGANMTTRTDDTVYGFNCNLSTGTTTDKLEHDLYDFATNKHAIYTIWDAGGNDTIDASGYETNQRIDLHAGAYSDIGDLKQNIAIAYGVTIENATGGSGDDIIIGNDAGNWLEGGAGKDRLIGGAGNDTLVGGTGDDTYILDSISALHRFGRTFVGYDPIIENEHGGIDTVEVARSSVFVEDGLRSHMATFSSYTLGSHLENATVIHSGDFDLTGNSYGNTLTGNDSVNRLDGGSGNDTLDAKGGFDTLIGGTGDDTYVLGSVSVHNDGTVGYDTIVEQSHGGIDTVDVGRASIFVGDESHIATVTRYTLGSHLENATVIGSGDFDLTGNSYGNKLIGNDGANRLDGGTGDDRLTGFVGNDHFVFAGTHFGNDTVTDFTAGDGSNHDTAVIDKNVCADFSVLQSHMHETTTHSELNVVHNTVLSFGSDKSITLSHVSAATLTRGDFAFV